MNSKKLVMGIAAAFAVSGTAPALAAGWYAGISAGYTYGQVNNGRIAGDLRALGFSSAEVTGDTRENGGRLYVGRHLLRWLAAEAYYADLGRNNWRAAVTPTGTLEARSENRAYGVALLPGFSPGKDVMVFGKLGVARTEAKSTFVSTGFVDLESTSRKDNSTAGVYGVGAAWRFDRGFVRLDLDSHATLGSNETGGKYKVRALNVGVGFAF